MGLYPEENNSNIEDIDDSQDFNQAEYVPENDQQMLDRFIVPTPRSSDRYSEIVHNGKRMLIKEPTKYLELFKSDMTTSNLKDFGLWSVQECAELAIGIREFADQNEFDLSRSANFFAQMMYVELNTSKGVKLELLRAIRTSRQESQSNIERTQKFDQPKKKWGFF